ncbi:16S rRNA (cytosine(967)-C(5))-methyltransferase RsmB [Myxococcota bacterium]|nr:16S rRNA (cytosine(967)-C(5))-methyltransferase RsmB [Myxococcota bacterium]MBU1536669.1 16S rRNA (cytosine(967)-C(5))-methyltransferase RsmB [Myxococcota bacterium]
MDISNEPRILAATVLSRVEKHQAYANIAFDAIATSSRIPSTVKNLGKELVFGVLRNRSRLEEIVSQFLKLPLRKSHPTVRYHLLIATYQLLYLDNIPDGFVVDRAVEIVKLSLGSSPASFVNAVLHQVLKNRPFSVDSSLSETQRIEQELSFPPWIARVIMDSAPEGEAYDLARALNQRSRSILRTNTLKNDREALLVKLAEQFPDATFQPTEFSPNGIEALGMGDPIRQPLHREGYYLIQDASSQLIAPFVAVTPGARVLDACAGTGGKTLHMAALMENQGSILSVDLKQSKMDALEQRAARVGTTIVKTRAMDLLTTTPEGTFSHILLDAPCSGLGVLRRHPEAKWRIAPEEIGDLVTLQRSLLERMVPLLESGGTLVYVVCTFNHEETFHQINGFLERHPDFILDSAPKWSPIDWGPLTNDQGCLTIWPQRHNGDGFFAARLIRR